MRSNQYANGGVASNTLLNVGAYSGAATNLSTGSTGNSGHAEVTGATLTGVYSQFTSAQPGNFTESANITASVSKSVTSRRILASSRSRAWR